MQETEIEYDEYMSFVPLEPVDFELADPFKSLHTEEENFRAYRLFSMIDLDGSGSVTLREIERVLDGFTDVRTLKETFPDADTGLVFDLGQIRSCHALFKTNALFLIIFYADLSHSRWL